MQVSRCQAGKQLPGSLTVLRYRQTGTALQLCGDQGKHIGIGPRFRQLDRQRRGQQRVINLQRRFLRLPIGGRCRDGAHELGHIDRRQYGRCQIRRTGRGLPCLVAIDKQRKLAPLFRQLRCVNSCLLEEGVDLLLFRFASGQRAKLLHRRRIALPVEHRRQLEYRIVNHRQSGDAEPVARDVHRFVDEEFVITGQCQQSDQCGDENCFYVHGFLPE
ncbi:hypothetical protein [Pseudomonas sp. UMAB-40]|uniref:hypothetical protein n=1 Tax=Pseudomonas sp. UMAB-40 TaxID=1365407 RepID=UPI0035A5BDD1